MRFTRSGYTDVTYKPVVKAAQDLVVQSQDAGPLHGRKAAAECQLPMASHRHQVQPAAPGTVCVVMVSVSGVQMTSAAAVFAAAAAVAADQTDCDWALAALHHHVV